jgi:N-acyl homoserine lactone hydrolase
MPGPASPRRLELPLSGGRPDATVRVHPLLAGEVLMPPAFIARPSGLLKTVRGLGFATPRSRWYWAPIPCFLVEHPAGPFLIDTGLDPSCVEGLRENLGRLGALAYKVRMAPEQAIVEQVRARGIDPASVELVVMTHLHWDHSSGISQWPAATFVVPAVEWRSANAHGIGRGYYHSHFNPAFDWRTIDYADGQAASYESFSSSVDLFGDGSVRLVFTPGHSEGHQSVVVRLSGGRELVLTADAAYAQRTLDESLLPTIFADEHLFQRSLKEIQLYLEPRANAVVVPGHDPDVWAQLSEVYE